MSKEECVICGEEAKVTYNDFGVADLISCNNCGKYIIHQVVKDNIDNDKLDKNKFYACLYYYFLHFKKKERIYLIVDEKYNDDNHIQISVDEILNLYPKTISEKIDKVLLNLSVIIQELGQSCKLKPLKSLRVFMATNTTEAYLLFKIMADEFGYISGDCTLSDDYSSLQITYKGWNRVDEISKDIKKYKKGFIAMWFDNSMSLVREAIKDVFIETGYQVSIIDEKEYNKQIVPEILYEIQTSDFIVADLTGNRNGVYYEAGYALGLGKEVILMTEISETDKEKNLPHFDVAQVNQVRYESVEDLKVKLFNRITATVGNLKNPNIELKSLPLKNKESKVEIE